MRLPLSAAGTGQTGPWAPGELSSLAELLDEVKDGEDREDRDEVTVQDTGKYTRGKENNSDLLFDMLNQFHFCYRRFLYILFYILKKHNKKN